MNHKKTALTILLSLFSILIYAQETKRIISLAPSITKNIYYLGAIDQLVGCTSFCTEAQNTQAVVVATAVNVSIEKTVALKPDIVLTTPMTNPETLELFRKLKIETIVIPTPKSFDEVCEQFIFLGNLLEREETANEIVNTSKSKVNSIRVNSNGKGIEKIFFQIGAKPLFTVLPGTYMNDFITFTGATNIADGMTSGSITRESVLSKNPDMILVVTMGITGEEEKSNWEAYKGLKAADKKQVFIIDAEKACSPTPIDFAETLETLINIIKNLP
jgi:ABC-type Fe3+-hydroxamate transport system substrate-binding protein